jgi:hypothetical protein
MRKRYLANIVSYLSSILRFWFRRVYQTLNKIIAKIISPNAGRSNIPLTSWYTTNVSISKYRPSVSKSARYGQYIRKNKKKKITEVAKLKSEANKSNN